MLLWPYTFCLVSPLSELWRCFASECCKIDQRLNMNTDVSVCALSLVTFLSVVHLYNRISKLHLSECYLFVNVNIGLLPRVFTFPRPWSLCLFSVSHLGCRSSCWILHLPRACSIRNCLCLEVNILTTSLSYWYWYILAGGSLLMEQFHLCRLENKWRKSSPGASVVILILSTS